MPLTMKCRKEGDFMIYGKKYIYECPWGHAQAEFKSFNELMLFLHAKYDSDPAIPSYYRRYDGLYKSIRRKVI